MQAHSTDLGRECTCSASVLMLDEGHDANLSCWVALCKAHHADLRARLAAETDPAGPAPITTALNSFLQRQALVQ